MKNLKQKKNKIHIRNEIAKYTLYFLLLISILCLIVCGVFYFRGVPDFGIELFT